jgi:radical SAM superfamily enzyme with C-terminal helix-hairpin-helix motif
MVKKFHIIGRDSTKNQGSNKQKIYPIQVSIPDYKQTHDYICNMIVNYSDHSVKSLIGRVLYNELKQKWIVDGMAVTVNVDQQASNVSNEHDFTTQSLCVS